MATGFSRRSVRLGYMACVVVLCLGQPAAAAVSFEGSSVELIIASDEGGGTDLVGRLFARYFEKYLPGHPKFVIKNMGAGAKKILAANYVAAAKPDGLTLMSSDPDTLQGNLLKSDAVRYDPSKLRVVGAMNRGGSVVFVRKEAMKRLTDPSAEPVIVGDQAGQHTWEAMLVWGKRFLGWNLRWVKGYKGTGAVVLALRSGEVDCFATDGVNVIHPLQQEGIIDLLVQQGFPEHNTFAPRKDFQDVPVFPLMLAKANPGDLAFRGYRSVTAPSDVDKWLSLPPGTPEPILAAYRTAFDRITQDPEFLAAVHKQVSEELHFADGAEAEKQIAEIRGTPREATDYADKLRAQYGLVQN